MDNVENKQVKLVRIQQKKFVEVEKQIDQIEEDHDYYLQLETEKKKLETMLLKTTAELALNKSESVFAEIKDVFKQLENIELELKEKKENLKKYKAEKKIIEKELEKLETNLVKQKKIEWVEMSFEDWYLDSYDNFWIYSTDCGNEMGIWKGYDELNQEEVEHFDNFELDYFYYGEPNYYNCYYPNSEMSEAEMARENGCAIVKRINRYDLN